MQRIVTFVQRMKRRAAELNLFEDETAQTDPFNLRTAIIATRVYIVGLALSLIILVVFNMLDIQPEIIIILNPSQSAYEDFLNKYGNLSSCPCSRTTIPYVNFTSTTVDYHPLCQSIFVSNDWIEHLSSPEFINLYQLDFRTLASSYFQLLATFCSHIKRSVNNTFDNFHLQTFLTSNVLLQDSLDVEINVTSQFLRSSIANNVRQLLQLVRTTTQTNELQTAVPITKYMYMVTIDDVDVLRTQNSRFRHTPIDVCSCYSIESCSMPSGFYNSSEQASVEIKSALYITPIANVTGFVVGCSPIESLLQSTIECLFDSSCLNTIHTFIPFSNITDVNVLNEIQTRFLSDDSIEMLINQLFIETWSIKANFSNYYAQCAPILCSHTLSKRKHPLYIINNLLGLYGGLTAILRFFVPRIIVWWRKRRTVAAVGRSTIESFLQYLRMAWPSIRTKIRELNLFKTRTMRTDPFEQRTSKISTWIYLVLLMALTIIIVFFNWINVRMESRIVTYPTLTKFEELDKKYSRSLECPCSLISIQYSSFITMAPRFHSVCTSLLTTDRWINLLDNTIKLHTHSIYKDILEAGPKFFSSLQTVCGLMGTIVSDASFSFNRSSLITNRVLSYVELMARAEQILNQFKSNTVGEAKRSLALIDSQTVTMYTTGETDVSWRHFSWRNSSYFSYFQPIPMEIGNCSCGLHENCKQRLGYYIYEGNSQQADDEFEAQYYIPNMFSSCFVTQSLRQSSLECFFDRRCAGPIARRAHHNVDKILLRKTSTTFSHQMLLQSIIDKMMLETWGENINHSQYYKQCAPKICTYFVASRNNALYAFTTTIGLFGGISTALHIIVPRIVTWIGNMLYRRRNMDNRTDSRTLCDRVRALWCLIKNKMLELNLFESEAAWDNQDLRRQEIITTRLYLLLLICSLMIIILYSTVTVQSQSFIKNNPSQSYFERHASNPRYSPTLDCPCQNISTPYKLFTSISLQYHQLCSSDFIIQNSIWINLISSRSNLSDYPYDDYRRFIVPHFRLLFYLCTLTNDTLVDALSTFRSSVLISIRAQSRQTVLTQMKANMNQFRSSVPRMFVRTLDFIQEMAKGNRLMSSIGSNWYPIPEKEREPVPLAPRTYGKNNCSCGSNPNCVSLATIDGWNVPGFLVGCYPLESLLRSTLQCLYDITCINKLRNKNQFSSMNIRPLNSTLSFPNATVRSLIDELMVEQWESDISYDNYYAACAPLSCAYVIKEKGNYMYMITIIISSFGGLTVALKIIAPVLLKIARSIMMYHRRRIAPDISVST